MDSVDEDDRNMCLASLRVIGFLSTILVILTNISTILVIFTNITTWPFYTIATWPFHTMIGVFLAWSCLHTIHQLDEESPVPSLLSFLSGLYPPRNLLDPEDTCAFCKDTFINPVTFACNHIFCFDCVNQLIERFEHCPLCRRRLFCPDPLGRHMRTLFVAAVKLAYTFLNSVGICFMFGPDSTIYARLGSLVWLLLWDFIGLLIACAIDQGVLPRYDSLMCVRKAVGRRTECYAMRLMWTTLFIVAIVWASSHAMTLQIAYARRRGWGWSEIEQKWASVQP